MQEQFQEQEEHKLDEGDNFSNALNTLKTDVTHVDIEFPFDLNNLFSMQYSFDTLKAAIEFLAK